MLPTEQDMTQNIQGSLHSTVQNNKNLDLPNHGETSGIFFQVAGSKAVANEAKKSYPLPDGTPSLSRKRPNRAQRRQMDSRLSSEVSQRSTKEEQKSPSDSGNHAVPRPQVCQNHAHNAPYQQQFLQQSSVPMNFNPSQSLVPSQLYYDPFHDKSRKLDYRSHISYPKSQEFPTPNWVQNNNQASRFFVQQNFAEVSSQSHYLDKLIEKIIPSICLEPKEISDKDKFRSKVEECCRNAIAQYEKDLGNSSFNLSTIELRCFGSLISGFATKASDMDLALLTPYSNPSNLTLSVVPRLLEKQLLDAGYGARLLTKTRVPIIKLCANPTPKLRSDLLKSRANWENSLQIEDHSEDNVANRQGVNKGHQIPLNSWSAILDQDMDSLCRDKLSSLSQSKNQTLEDYFDLARQILTELGVCDYLANGPSLNAKKVEILKSVCKAFIEGLSSTLISLRLQNYKSLRPLFDVSDRLPLQSLQTTYDQVVGEELAIAFDFRPLAEANEKNEFEAQALVQAWQTLQDTELTTRDIFTFGRKVRITCEKLKKVPSLQLALLEQMPYEDPGLYFLRTKKIMDSLKYAKNKTTGYVRSLVVGQYVSGVRNETIRELLQRQDNRNTTLPQIGWRHQILQLADDYEKALELGLYLECDRGFVKLFVEQLKSLDSHEPHLCLPKSTLAKIKSLPDPTKLSLNRPRDYRRDPLEFPKANVGIQCDINFSAELAIHNTHLLRCYASCDPRVKDMVLFIKHWANTRSINNPYLGSLCSYGYVLMVLHYLVNIAQPFVCPNLQMIRSNFPDSSLPSSMAVSFCNGRDVRFWRNEMEITSLAQQNLINQNHETVGMLVRGFFKYYSQSEKGQGFSWNKDVLSLRRMGGLLTKKEKGWVNEKTVKEVRFVAAPPARVHGKEISSNYCNSVKSGTRVKTMEETKQIRHRYLLAIEDPFELDHNVARTVNYNGITCIKHEFRRAWKIIGNSGKPGQSEEEELLDPGSPVSDKKGSLLQILALLCEPGFQRSKTGI